MESLLNPVTYIDRHLEPPIQEEQAVEFAHRIGEPLEHVSYKDAGEVELRADHVVAYYEYRPATFVPAKKNSREPHGSPEDWRELSELVLLNEKSGDAIELSGLYPEEYDTAFRVTDERWEDSYHDHAARTVVVGSSLLAPVQFALLLHEVGHAVDKVANPYLYDNLARVMWQLERGDPVAQSIVLMKERNAWAFALNTMRPFLSSDPKSAFNSVGIKKFIHRACLQTYSNEIRKAREGKKRYLANLAITAA